MNALHPLNRVVVDILNIIVPLLIRVPGARPHTQAGIGLIQLLGAGS